MGFDTIKRISTLHGRNFYCSGNNALASSNVVGSSIFNSLLVPGITSTLSPITFPGVGIVGIVLLTAMRAFLWFLCWTKHTLNHKEGIMLLSAYAIYLIYICVR